MAVRRFYLAVWMVAASAFGANRIMLIGDSITEGYFVSSSGLGFRDKLYARISESGWPFEFVGSDGTAPYQAHYRNGGVIRQFYPGWTGMYDGDVTSGMNLWQPSVVVIHLGTNDMGSWDPIRSYSSDGGTAFDTSHVSGRMATLLGILCQWKTGVKGSNLKTIFLSQIIPKNKPRESDRVVEFNFELGNLVADADSGKIPAIPPGTIRLVDQYTTFNVETMIAPGDGIHPNDAGYTHMTDVFWQALRTMPMHIVSSQTEWEGPSDLPVGPVEAQVTDDFGNPVSGVQVCFTVTAGTAALVEPDTVLTDSSGIARATVLLGGAGISTVRAEAEDLVEAAVEFTLTSQEPLAFEGHVRYRGTTFGEPGVTVGRSGSDSSIVTDALGRFRLDLPFDGHEVVLVPSKPRWSGIEDHPITDGDARLAAYMVAGLAEKTTTAVKAADVDGDGQVTAWDAALIARYTAGITDTFAVNLGVWFFAPDSMNCGVPEIDLSGLDIEGTLCGDVDGE